MRNRQFTSWVSCLVLVVLGVAAPIDAREDKSVMLDETVRTVFMADMVQHVYFETSAIPVTQANKVLQTRDGYIWIASYDGLIRFDGQTSKIYGPEDGLHSSTITNMYEDRKGVLWIATNNAGLFMYQPGRGFRQFNRNQGLPSATVRDIAEDSAGNVYAATALGIVVVTPSQEISQVRRGRTRNSIPCRKIMIDQADRIWCIKDNGAVSVVRTNGGFVRELNARSTGGHEFNATFQARDGTIYLGTRENRVIVLQDGESDDFDVIDTDGKVNINSLYEDDQDRVWVCTDTGMGFIRDLRFQPVEGGLIEGSLENMFQDYEGGFWVASSRKGVLHLSKSKFRDVSLAHSLPELTVNSTRYYHGKLYIGADEGLIILQPDGTRLHNDLTRMLEGIRIRALTSDDAGNLWICTYTKYGVIRYRDDGTIVSISEKDGLRHNRVRCALPLPDGSLAVGTNEGISFIRNDRVVRTISRRHGLWNPMILCLCLGENGDIYAGSDGGGIYRIGPGGLLQTFDSADGLTSDVILRIVRDPFKDGYWISTSDSLHFMKDHVIRAVTSISDYISSVFDIKFGRDGTTWLLTSRGVCVVQPGDVLDPDQTPEIELFSRRDGLTSTVTANSWSHLLDDGRLFISCNRGVIVIDLDEVRRNTVRPKLAINRVIVDDVVHERPDAVDIPADARRVTIDFAVLSYAYTSGNEVTVRLNGFDEAPGRLSIDNTTRASYTNLPGGKYEFHIVGRNKEGVESEPLVLPLTKQPAFFEHPSVRAVSGILAVGLTLGFAWLYYRYKTRALRKRQEEYRNITEQAISAIADTIDAKDEYTAGHSQRVALYSREIAKRMGMQGEELENLYYTALLHDIGKIGLEDAILKKRGGLTDEEYEKMKRHPSIGGDILRSITVVNNIAQGARYHHERFDGKGYPAGLKGEEIPLFARIICIADAFDAMSTNRPYRSSLDDEYILGELHRCAGAQFDSRIIPHMIEIARQRHTRPLGRTRIFKRA